MPHIDCCVRQGLAASGVEQHDAERKRYTGLPLHDAGAKELSWNVVGTNLLLGAEPAYLRLFLQTESLGRTPELVCGRYAKARANKPATGEDILVAHLSPNPERRHRKIKRLHDLFL
jgi:hypothetical protein